MIDIYFVKENNIPYSNKTNIPEVSGIGGLQNILGETLPVSITYKTTNAKLNSMLWIFLPIVPLLVLTGYALIILRSISKIKK